VSVAIFDDDVWQMSRGERAAVEGVLAQLRPSLALEIGSAEGACLTRIAAHAAEVHSFDLAPPTLPAADNVTVHTGNSHELLPSFLSELADQGRTVDFVLVDGDHSPEGVRQDLEDLLDSAAVTRTVILIHDTANERVRLGVDAVRFRAWPKVTHVELDWIPGQLFAEPKLRNELWYGIGLVLVDSSRLAYTNGSVYEQRYYPSAPLLKEARDRVVAREQLPPDGAAELAALRARVTELTVELATSRGRRAPLQATRAAYEAELDALRERVARADRTLDDIKRSMSWRITEPIRYVKRRARRGAKS
jgi:hypothetical protein